MRPTSVPSSALAHGSADIRPDGEVPLTFGLVEARLAGMHGIASSRRTAFASRLKNLHRLGIPSGLATSKGKRSIYSAGQVFELALAAEFTQLGLTPERIVRLLALDPLPMFMAARMAARSLAECEAVDQPARAADPMYLYFDPAALSDLTVDWDLSETPDSDRALATFFYGGRGVVAEMLRDWTEGTSTRAAFVNITRMLDQVAGPTFSNSGGLLSEVRSRFFAGVIEWADELEETAGDDELATSLYNHLITARCADIMPGGVLDSDTVHRVARESAAERDMPERIAAVAADWVLSPENLGTKE